MMAVSDGQRARLSLEQSDRMHIACHAGRGAFAPEYGLGNWPIFVGVRGLPALIFVRCTEKRYAVPPRGRQMR